MLVNPRPPVGSPAANLSFIFIVFFFIWFNSLKFLFISPRRPPAGSPAANSSFKPAEISDTIDFSRGLPGFYCFLLVPGFLFFISVFRQLVENVSFFQAQNMISGCITPIPPSRTGWHGLVSKHKIILAEIQAGPCFNHLLNKLEDFSSQFSGCPKKDSTKLGHHAHSSASATRAVHTLCCSRTWSLGLPELNTDGIKMSVWCSTCPIKRCPHSLAIVGLLSWQCWNCLVASMVTWSACPLVATQMYSGAIKSGALPLRLGWMLPRGVGIMVPSI